MLDWFSQIKKKEKKKKLSWEDKVLVYQRS